MEWERKGEEEKKKKRKNSYMKNKTLIMRWKQVK